MKVIFFKDVPGSGRRLDVKDVSDGYATNFLLPKNLVVKATPQEIAKLESIKALENKKKEEYEAELAKNLKKVSEIVVELHAPINEKGHLFKGITKEEIIAKLKNDHKIVLNPSHILLDKPIKEAGEHKISIKVGNSNGFFMVKVVGE